jgi:hypothetical protein
MSNENIQPAPVDTVLTHGMILFLASAIIMLDALGDFFLHYVPKNILWYMAAFIMSSTILGFAWHMSRKTNILDIVVDLCLYDVLIQLFGMLMFLERWNPPVPYPIPYDVAANSLTFIKLIALLWPLFIKTPWPVIGIYSWVNRRNTIVELPKATAATIITVIFLPIITTAIAYQILCIISEKKILLDIRWIIGILLVALYYRNMNTQLQAKEIYAKEQAEFNEMASTHHLYENDLSDDDRMIMNFVASDPVRGK